MTINACFMVHGPPDMPPYHPELEAPPPQAPQTSTAQKGTLTEEKPVTGASYRSARAIAGPGCGKPLRGVPRLRAASIHAAVRARATSHPQMPPPAEARATPARAPASAAEATRGGS